MSKLQDLLDLAVSYRGYIEKASNACLDSYRDNRGDKNYTKFSRDVNAVGLNGCQAQPWCATFQFAMELYIYGKETALKHWHMTDRDYVGYNCFSTFEKFRAAGQTGKKPKPGALVVFTFSHMGRVVRTYTKNGIEYFDCIEGNTSANPSDRNGGQVYLRTRKASDSNIKGFCYIDYSEPVEYVEGWMVAADGVRWWYQYKDGSFATGWKRLRTQAGEYWFYFDSDGYMLTGWQKINGRWYYLSESLDSTEGALWHEADDHSGALEVWRLD